MREGEPGPENFINPELMQLPETRLERIMEQASREQLRLFVDYLVKAARELNESKAFQKGLNLAPLFGDIIMAGKALLGREGKQTLPKKERFIYATAAITEFLSVLLMYEGRLPEAGMAHIVSETISKADAIAPLIKAASGKIMEKNPKLAHTFNVVREWVAEKKERAPQLAEIMRGSVQTLGLESIKADE